MGVRDVQGVRFQSDTFTVVWHCRMLLQRCSDARRGSLCDRVGASGGCVARRCCSVRGRDSIAALRSELTGGWSVENPILSRLDFEVLSVVREFCCALVLGIQYSPT